LIVQVANQAGDQRAPDHEQVGPLERYHEHRDRGKNRNEDGPGTDRLAYTLRRIRRVEAALVLRKDVPQPRQDEKSDDGPEAGRRAHQEKDAAEQPQRSRQMPEVIGDEWEDV
jgi:hypothetical protein